MSAGVCRSPLASLARGQGVTLKPARPARRKPQPWPTHTSLEKWCGLLGVMCGGVVVTLAADVVGRWGDGGSRWVREISRSVFRRVCPDHP